MMSTAPEWMRDVCTDWDGRKMADQEETRRTVSCGEVRLALSTIEDREPPFDWVMRCLLHTFMKEVRADNVTERDRLLKLIDDLHAEFPEEATAYNERYKAVAP